MTTAAEFQEKVDKAVVNMTRLDAIVNGDDETTVTTDSGPVPSLAKAIADLAAGFELEDYAQLDGATFTGPVIVPAPTLDGHAATKEYVDEHHAGYIEATVDTDGGTLDLSAMAGTNGGVVFATSDGLDDNNIWQFTGLQKGDSGSIIFDDAFGLLFKDDFWGDQKIFGNWEGADRQDADNNSAVLPVNERDILNYICIDVVEGVSICRVWLTENQYIGRPLVQGAGSSQDPEGAFFSIGTVGLWKADKGIPYGDFLMYTNGTVRKPICGGLILRGGGDSSSIFFENYAIEGQDEGAGLDVPGYCVPWDDYKRIGNRIAWTAKVADGTGKIIACDAIIGEGAPGSLNQGEYATVQGYASALPTTASTPGGLVLQSTPAGINCPIDRLVVSSTGAVVILGQAAMETFDPDVSPVDAFIAATNARLDEYNVDQWHAPSLDILREGPHYGDLQMYASPVNSGREYAAWSVRQYGNHDDGVDFGWREDQNTHWFYSVDGDVRTPVAGFQPGNDALLLGGGAKIFSFNPLLDDDDAFTYQLPNSVAGMLMVSLSDSSYSAIGSFNTYDDVVGGMVEMVSGSAIDWGSGALTGTTGTNGHLTLKVHTDNKIYVENRTGAPQIVRVWGWYY